MSAVASVAHRADARASCTGSGAPVTINGTDARVFPTPAFRIRARG